MKNKSKRSTLQVGLGGISFSLVKQLLLKILINNLRNKDDFISDEQKKQTMICGI